jgi:hypothetical protein
VTRLARYVVDHFLVLPLGVLVALVWANTGGETYFQLAGALAFVVTSSTRSGIRCRWWRSCSGSSTAAC